MKASKNQSGRIAITIPLITVGCPVVLRPDRVPGFPSALMSPGRERNANPTLCSLLAKLCSSFRSRVCALMWNCISLCHRMKHKMCVKYFICTCRFLLLQAFGLTRKPPKTHWANFRCSCMYKSSLSSSCRDSFLSKIAFFKEHTFTDITTPSRLRTAKG